MAGIRKPTNGGKSPWLGSGSRQTAGNRRRGGDEHRSRFAGAADDGRQDRPRFADEARHADEEWPRSAAREDADEEDLPRSARAGDDCHEDRHRFAARPAIGEGHPPRIAAGGPRGG